MIKCPPQKHLARLLAENPNDADSEILLDHLGECESCRKLLQRLSVDAEEWQTWEQRLHTTGVNWPAAAKSNLPGPADWPTLPGYEILGILGGGGMGVVYLARQKNLGRPVALKKLRGHFAEDEEFRRRFRREAETLAHVQHPNLVQIHDFIDGEEGLYLVMEYVPGVSLAQRLREATLAPGDAAQLLEILARAVQSAHDAGVVHRDLKPANILLGSEASGSSTRAALLENAANGQAETAIGVPDTGGDGVAANPPASSPRPSLSPQRPLHPKIADFGLARRIEVDGETKLGDIMGTPAYMAPEQARGDEDWSKPPVDIYALGVILYECLTGRPPFHAESAYATLLQIVRDDAAPPSRLQPGIPADLATICLKCLEKSPAGRYATCGDLADDLRRFQTGEPIHARRVSLLQRSYKWMRRRPISAALLSSVSLAVLLLISMWLYYTGQLRAANFAYAQENARAEAESKKVTEQRKIAETALKKAAAERRQAETAWKATKLLNRDMDIAFSQWTVHVKKLHSIIENNPELRKPASAKLRRELQQQVLIAYDKALGRLNNFHHLHLIRAEGYQWLGDEFIKIDNKAKAITYLEKSVTFYGALYPDKLANSFDKVRLGDTHLALANLYGEIDKQKRVQEHLHRAYDVFQKEVESKSAKDGSVHYRQALTANQLGYVLHRYAKKLDLARTYLLSGRQAIHTSLGRRPTTAGLKVAVSIERNLERLYRHTKKTKEADDARRRAAQYEKQLMGKAK